MKQISETNLYSIYLNLKAKVSCQWIGIRECSVAQCVTCRASVRFHWLILGSRLAITQDIGVTNSLKQRTAQRTRRYDRQQKISEHVPAALRKGIIQTAISGISEHMVGNSYQVDPLTTFKSMLDFWPRDYGDNRSRNSKISQSGGWNQSYACNAIWRSHCCCHGHNMFSLVLRTEIPWQASSPTISLSVHAILLSNLLFLSK